MSDQLPLPNPDIMIRRKNGVSYLRPETVRGEEWLLAQGLPDRPGRLVGPDLVIEGRKSFGVTKAEAEEIMGRGVGIGLVIRKQKTT